MIQCRLTSNIFQLNCNTNLEPALQNECKNKPAKNYEQMENSDSLKAIDFLLIPTFHTLSKHM